MKFTVPDLRLFKKMVIYANSDDEKELSKSLHKEQPYFCNIIDPIAYDSRCLEVHRFCTLFCSIASEHVEQVLNTIYEEYIKIPEEYFNTIAHLVAQKNINIGKRGLTYPDRINKYVLNKLDFDNEDTEWLLIMIPSFLYTIESFYSKQNPENFFMDYTMSYNLESKIT